MRKSEEEKSKKKKRKAVEGMPLESILDINTTNVWNLEPEHIGVLWEAEKIEGSFTSSEEKLLNTIRLAFEVVHYNQNDPRELEKYENGEWVFFSHCSAKKQNVAIRKKHITKLTDLTYENIHHVTAATLLELIDRNFGGGWDSISLPIRDIIEAGFEVSTTTLPEKRMHMVGGTLDKKVAQGFEVLEIVKGTWIEAIFVKKKDKAVKLRLNDSKYDEEGNLLKRPVRDDDEEDLPEDPELEMDDDDDDNISSDETMDETYYSTFSEEANQKENDEETEGLSLEEY